MPSSLATQLAQNASLNASILSTSRRKPTESYLFPVSQASTHDLESIHFLASNAFLQFKNIQPSCRKYEAALFSDAVKDVDRTLLSKEMDEELNVNLRGFLKVLGPWLMEGISGKLIEWLVRRFRINEFNVEDTLSVFLPYHESPHFAKMLSILHIAPQSRFSFLLPFKAAAKHLPRTSLVSTMVQDTEVARFVSSLLPSAHQSGHSHRALIAFNIGVMHEYIVRSKVLDEGVMSFVVSALVETLQAGSDSNVVLGSYVLLSTLSQKGRLSIKATKAIVGSMVDSASKVSNEQFLKASVAFCEPQDQANEFGDAVVGKVLKLSNIEEDIQKALGWQGSEKFVGPLLSGIVAQLPEETARAILQSILATNNVPTVLTRRLAGLLIDAVISAEGDSAADVTSHRALLSTIQQRYPSILQKSAEERMVGDDDAREVVEQLVISLTVTYTKGENAKAHADMIVASTSADQNVRVIAVNQLLKTLMSPASTQSLDLPSVYSALLARAHDTKASVIQALYSAPSAILPILSSSSESYIVAVTQALSTNSSRPLIRAHLSFLASHFCNANVSLIPEIFIKCFFPFLLFSKSKKETAKAVWEIIEAEKDGIGKYEILQGCVDDWRWQSDKPAGESIDVMASTNMAIAARMAENILASTEYSSHLESLLKTIRDENAHSRALAHLVARALLSRLSGDQRIDAAKNILEAMHLDTLEGMEDFSDGDSNNAMLVDDRSLGLKVVQKPAGRKTVYWLQTSILVLLPTIVKPTGVLLDWFANAPSGMVDQRGWRYVSLLRDVYKVANSSASLPLLSTNIIRSLFLNLKDDSLVFLAGIITRSLSKPEDKGICVIALRHAYSFFQAQPNVDFQAVLPSLIIALQHINLEIREATLDCIAIMVTNHRNVDMLYGSDTIYGEGSANLTFLDVNDWSRYTQAILDYRDLIGKDGQYFKIFQRQHLTRAKSDSKADSKYKQRVLSFIFSHVVAIGLASAKCTLLRSTENISDQVKVQALFPCLQELVQSPILGGRLGPHLEEYTALLLSSFDISSSNELNDPESSFRSVFISSLRQFFQPGSVLAAREVLGRNLEHGLFSALNLDLQAEICILLLQIGAQHPNTYDSKRLLGSVLNGAPLIQHLLARLHLSSNPTAPPAKKRVKLDDPEDQTYADDPLPSLSLLAEVLAASALPGSLDLISRLLDTLNSLLHYEAGDKSYVEQLLMAAIENAAESVVEIPNLSPSAIRLDILVELIRVSDNTQTFHQALLLMASLARLTPESVLHNIMPVFTFMGSNVFHRDDSYSFRVVQQTVSSIVPVMVSSLKNAHSGRIGLYVGARDFLRIFTDAANHIPRHRRTNFFSHLVDVLGPEDFLAPVCMLLVEKMANRVARQNADELQGSLALPISILHHYSQNVQISTLTEILGESQRLATRVIDPERIEPMFLDLPRDDEHAVPALSMMKRRSKALITFVGFGLQSTPSVKRLGDAPLGASMSELVPLLVHLATLRGGQTAESSVDQISAAARSAIARSLGVMHAADFMAAVVSMLKSDDARVQSGALDLFTDRLQNVAVTIRQEATATINEVIEYIRRIVSSSTEESLVVSAFQALRVVAGTISPGEENSLAKTIPSALTAIRSRKAVSPAMMALPSLITGLGPRVIPNFREIIDVCVFVIREGTEDQKGSEIVGNALSVLQRLLVSIPTFWGREELTQVVRLYTERYTASNTQLQTMTPLIKSIAKRAPAKILLPTLYELWPSINASSRPNWVRMVAYFDMLKRSLRAAPRSIVLENLRPLFKVFVEAFDVPSQFPLDDATEIEGHSIAAFLELVVKLNEAAFRPLFRRLYDWAFASGTDTMNARKVTFCHVYTSLLEFFKGLMTNYMSFILQPFLELLKAFSDSLATDEELWLCIIGTLSKSLKSDEGVFWRDDKLRRISPILIEQVAVCVRLGTAEGKTTLPMCLEAVVDAATDDALLKSINLDLLMHTRSDDVRLRTFALTCSENIWKSHGTKLLGFVAETITFIAECAEDENDLVVKESHRLKKAVESVAGNINGI